MITSVGGFLRFYLLDKYPVQLNHDEISQLYDTASVVQTGKDIYGNFLPLAFPSTGEYKVGHYIYITVLPYLIFGMREATIRIPAAFFGTLIIPTVFLFVRQLTKNWKLALISSAAIAITPSEIFYSRKSFENVIGIFFIFLGLFFLMRELEGNRSKLSFYLTALFLALPMYIYTSHTIVVPLVLIVFAALFWKKILTFKKRLLTMLIIWSLFLLPLIYITLTNPGIRFRAATVSVLQDVNLDNQLQSIDKSSAILSELYKFKVILEYSLIKYFKQFDPARIFGNGLDFTNQGMIGMGPLMLSQLPFFLLGIIFILRSSFFVNNGKFLLILFLLAMLPSGLTFEEYSPHRSVWSFAIMSIISSFGIYWFLQFIQKNASRLLRIGTICILISLLVINFIYFIHMYTVDYPFEKSQNMHYPYTNVALFAWSEYSKLDRIIVDPIYGQSAPVKAVAVHYYLAYYGGYPPSKFQKDLKIEKSGMSFDKFSIREIDWRKDQFLKNTLIIASPWSIPIDNIDKNKIIKRFNFYDGQPAFYAIKL